MVTVSLIISTYNWPAALDLCLKSVLLQSKLPDEVVIADDGSGKETKELIKKYQEIFPVPLTHVWHPDEGFQLAKIRNRAFAAATGEYLIQIDGDLILHNHFVKDHYTFKRKNCFVTASRVLLSPVTTKGLIDNNSIEIKKYSSGDRNFFNGIRFPAPILKQIVGRTYKTSMKNKYYVKGCNMAFWKKDLIKVNGYNETFTGWGREDSELAIRLMNANIHKRFLKLGGICYHLFHREASREMESRNTDMMEEASKKKFVFSPKGMNQYLLDY
ncbi:MAG: glycosyltransferase family 2 protein [Chitinophagaceae bacterium]|nr:glycosyltransferase family 2 protein [Chitinophagaceae bacterium]